MIELVRSWNARQLESYLDQVLDRGLDTRGIRQVPEIDAREGIPYVPSPWHVLPRALRAVGASGADVFVDFGCGKGRVVHQAARRPLKRVIGVEISPELARFAEALVATHLHSYRCPSVEIVVSDARRFRVPDDLTIAYLYAPFHGKTLDAVLGNLIESIDRHPRRLRLIYVLPLYGDQILATRRFRLVKWLRGGLRDTHISRAAIFESCC
jgi:SAM-dependent methyltransferase